MAEYKNQHFVPLLLLRKFANSDKLSIDLLSIKDRKIINNASIARQASKSYFYGKDKVIETELKKFETEIAPILNCIINNQELPPEKTFEHFMLNKLLVILISRTQYSADKLDEGLRSMIESAYEGCLDIEKYVTEYKESMGNPAAFSLGVAEQNVIAVSDLSYKLIINQTDNDFVISDNPVIQSNSFLELKKWPGSHYGFLKRGIQYFVPLDSKTYILFYDKDRYRVGNRGNKKIIISESNFRDVDIINEMAYLNAYKVIYFNKKFEEEYIYRICDSKYNKRRKTICNTGKFPQIENNSLKEISSYLIVQGEKPINYISYPSFIKFTKKAKREDIGNNAAQLRNERLAQIIYDQ